VPGTYAFVERSYDPDSEDEDKPSKSPIQSKDDYVTPKCQLEKPVQELMELIFNQQYWQATMVQLNYDANKLPLGKLSKNTILRGFTALKDLSAILDDPPLAATEHSMTVGGAMEHFSNLYYTLIPHSFGRNRPPVISDGRMLKKEIELLESLSDMKDAIGIMGMAPKKQDVHPADLQFQGLGMEEMTVLDCTSKEFILLADYLNESRGHMHNYEYEIDHIFRIERQGEPKRHRDFGFAPGKSDRRLLWHGSRCTNFGGILSQGLRIAPPEAPVSGYMFGKGIYLADMSSKSAGYCAHRISNGHALLLLCEAELGQPMQQLVHASYDAGTLAKKQGMVSTWGQGMTGPPKWMDAGCVHPSLKGVTMVSSD
jgi:poly [ADP-ribose] polymerase 2/3/4